MNLVLSKIQKRFFLGALFLIFVSSCAKKQTGGGFRSAGSSSGASGRCVADNQYYDGQANEAPGAQAYLVGKSSGDPSLEEGGGGDEGKGAALAEDTGLFLSGEADASGNEDAKSQASTPGTNDVILSLNLDVDRTSSEYPTAFHVRACEKELNDGLCGTSGPYVEDFVPINFPSGGGSVVQTTSTAELSLSTLVSRSSQSPRVNVQLEYRTCTPSSRCENFRDHCRDMSFNEPDLFNLHTYVNSCCSQTPTVEQMELVKTEASPEINRLLDVRYQLKTQMRKEFYNFSCVAARPLKKIADVFGIDELNLRAYDRIKNTLPVDSETKVPIPVSNVLNIPFANLAIDHPEEALKWYIDEDEFVTRLEVEALLDTEEGFEILRGLREREDESGSLGLGLAGSTRNEEDSGCPPGTYLVEDGGQTIEYDESYSQGESLLDRDQINRILSQTKDEFSDKFPPGDYTSDADGVTISREGGGSYFECGGFSDEMLTALNIFGDSGLMVDTPDKSKKLTDYQDPNQKLYSCQSTCEAFGGEWTPCLCGIDPDNESCEDIEKDPNVEPFKTLKDPNSVCKKDEGNEEGDAFKFGPDGEFNNLSEAFWGSCKKPEATGPLFGLPPGVEAGTALVGVITGLIIAAKLLNWARKTAWDQSGRLWGKKGGFNQQRYEKLKGQTDKIFGEKFGKKGMNPEDFFGIGRKGGTGKAQAELYNKMKAATKPSMSDDLFDEYFKQLFKGEDKGITNVELRSFGSGDNIKVTVELTTKGGDKVTIPNVEWGTVNSLDTEIFTDLKTGADKFADLEKQTGLFSGGFSNRRSSFDFKWSDDWKTKGWAIKTGLGEKLGIMMGTIDPSTRKWKVKTKTINRWSVVNPMSWYSHGFLMKEIDVKNFDINSKRLGTKMGNVLNVSNIAKGGVRVAGVAALGTLVYCSGALGGGGCLDASTFNLGEFCFGGDPLLLNKPPPYNEEETTKIAENLNQCLDIYMRTYQAFHSSMADRTQCLIALNNGLYQWGSLYSADSSYQIASNPNDVDLLVEYCFPGAPPSLAIFCQEDMLLEDADKNNCSSKGGSWKTLDPNITEVESCWLEAEWDEPKRECQIKKLTNAQCTPTKLTDMPVQWNDGKCLMDTWWLVKEKLSASYGGPVSANQDIISFLEFSNIKVDPEDITDLDFEIKARRDSVFPEQMNLSFESEDAFWFVNYDPDRNVQYEYLQFFIVQEGQAYCNKVLQKGFYPFDSSTGRFTEGACNTESIWQKQENEQGISLDGLTPSDIQIKARYCVVPGLVDVVPVTNETTCTGSSYNGSWTSDPNAPNGGYCTIGQEICSEEISPQ